jgi:hypothetical protein
LAAAIDEELWYVRNSLVGRTQRRQSQQENHCRRRAEPLERDRINPPEISLMYRTSYLSLLSLVLVSVPLAAADQTKKDCFFHKGDRIVFLGDSITMLWTL